MTSLYEHHLFLADLSEFLGLTGTVVKPVSSTPVPHPMQAGIVLDHVSFQYPGGHRPVLHDITLSIRSQEVVALVGANGSGKTTLIKLLCRLYDPTAGVISLDGIDFRQFQTTALRREISVLFQDYARHHVSARDNIWFGNVDLPPDHDNIHRAARQTGDDEVIAGLPNGYGTILGRWFEGGEELSVGEWQKVALARAFLRDAQILVLDGPSSALDAKAEYEVFRTFQELVVGHTAILISHRLSTVRMAIAYMSWQTGASPKAAHMKS